MTYSFDPGRRLVVVPVFLAGPRGGEIFDFAIDTAASGSAVSGLVLQQLGYSPSEATGRHSVRTAGGGLTASRIRVQRFATFGQVHDDYPVLWLPLAPASRVDGLLGLDFFRGYVLELDFIRGRISLALKRWWQFWR
jgi:Aspartyl protease